MTEVVPLIPRPEVEALTADRLFDVWPEASIQIDRALRITDTGYTLSSIAAAILAREMQLWRIGGTYAVTEIYVKPDHKALHVLIVAGENPNEFFHPLFDDLEAYGEAHGCKYVTALARRGWQRLKPVQERGYKPEMVLYKKELQHG